MLWLPGDGSQLGLYVPLGLLETGVRVGLKIVFWIGDIPEEKKYEILFNIYIREPVKKNVENSTFGGGSGPGHSVQTGVSSQKIQIWGGGPDPGIFHIKKKMVFKMHFKPF